MMSRSRRRDPVPRLPTLAAVLVLALLISRDLRAGSTPGTPCGTGAECASTLCVDGVCCLSACDGLCERCDGALAGSPGTCTPNPIGVDPETECSEVGRCQSYCDGAGTCTHIVCPDGEPCTDPAGCSSGFCVDDVCCEDACAGTCVACNLPAVEGACLPIPPGTDRDDDCPNSGGCVSTCDSAGGCDPVCGNLGMACGVPVECDSGFCVDGVCCNTACAGLCTSCAFLGSVGLCTPAEAGEDPDTDCFALGACPGLCDGTGACRRCLELGEPCETTDGCFTGWCVDGACCDSECDGICERCDAPGLEGTCTPVSAGTDPEGECPVGTCDGERGCSLGNDASVLRDAGPDASNVIRLPPPGCGCGCAVSPLAGDRGGMGVAALVVAALLWLGARRRRR